MASSEKDAALATTPSDAPTIFDKIIHKEIPSKVVYEDEKARVSGQSKFNATLGRASSPASEKLPSLWPRQDVTFINNDNFRTSNQIRVDSHPPPLATMVVHQDTSSSRNMETLPRLKSMTWIMQNRNSAPANRVAVITLKLQDYTNSTSGELEVKFQLSKDTLEAMLRTMTYISEQLSSSLFSLFVS
ncbi:protein FAR1-RELATED SEQUENCE 3-like isoform X2 [Musa acuminata AAA Group]|uniref:protein FAR1-RELATED SEQUENCE 3-like isoform X2 n=1 Tax=Musa acuminata AAA Group TaxID=214697 RepID=UPI0031DBC820